MNGRYFFGDYITNMLWSTGMSFSGGEAQVAPFASAVAHTLPFALNGVVSIDPDFNGEPVLTELNSGQVYRLVATP